MARRRVWGLDLGRSAVKGVLLERSGAGARILDADIVPLEGPPPDSPPPLAQDERLWQALGKFCEKNELDREAVCVAIPAHNTLVRDLTVPWVGQRKIEEMVRFEASNQIPFVLDEVMWDYTLFRQSEDEGTRRGLLLAIKKNVVLTYLRQFERVGLTQVELLTIAPMALLSFLHLELGQEGRAMLLDIGAQNTNLVAIGDGRVWMRNILGGSNQVTSLLEREFELDFDSAEQAKRKLSQSRHAKRILAAVRPAVDELLRQLRTNLSYLETSEGFTGFEVAYAVGGGSKLAGLKDLISRNLRHQLRDIAELRHIVVSPEANVPLIRANLDRLTVALGAGISGLQTKQHHVNFLPKEIGAVAALHRWRGTLLAVALLLWAVLLAAYGFGYIVRRNLSPALDAYGSVQQKYKDLRGKLASALRTASLEKELEYLLGLPYGKNQVVNVLNNLVRAFSDAGRRSPCNFQILTLNSTRIEPDEAGLKRGQPVMLSFTLKGKIVPGRGIDRSMAYSRFKSDLMPRLRQLPSLLKATGKAAFSKDSDTVRVREGDLSAVTGGDMIRLSSAAEWYQVKDVTSDTELTLTEPFKGEDVEGQFIVSDARDTAFNEELLEFAVQFDVPEERAPAVEEILNPKD